MDIIMKEVFWGDYFWFELVFDVDIKIRLVNLYFVFNNCN